MSGTSFATGSNIGGNRIIAVDIHDLLTSHFLGRNGRNGERCRRSQEHQVVKRKVAGLSPAREDLSYASDVSVTSVKYLRSSSMDAYVSSRKDCNIGYESVYARLLEFNCSMYAFVDCTNFTSEI